MENKSNTTNLNIKVDANLKKESDKLFKNLGLNMSTAINMFLIQCVKTASIPFAIAEPSPSKELKRALKEANYMLQYPEKYKGYNNINDLFEKLDIDN